jgi:hypothetical protein
MLELTNRLGENAKCISGRRRPANKAVATQPILRGFGSPRCPVALR